MLKRVITAAAAIGLLTAPVVAAETLPASGARALSLSHTMREGSDLSGGVSAGLIVGAIFVAAVVGLLVFGGGDDDDDSPVSP